MSQLPILLILGVSKFYNHNKEGALGNRVAVFILAIGVVIGCSFVSWAADPSARGYNWTGGYAGLNAGGAKGISDATTTTVFSPTGYFATTSVPAIARTGEQSLNNGNFIGGGQVGYCQQFGKFVIGGELDFNFSNITDSKEGTAVYPCCAPTRFTVKSSVDTDWLFTARPRIGYASNNWLFYATGGLAVTKLDADFIFTDTFANASEKGRLSKTQAGWTVGGGIEMGFTNKWSIKTEYLYANFGDVKTTSNNFTAFTPRIAFPTNTFTHTIDMEIHIVRIGLNYRF